MRERNLVFILGDQLWSTISSLREADKAQTRILMVEVMEEATCVKHHEKKIAFLFSAMRHFGGNLRAMGWLKAELSQTDSPPPLLHPDLAEVYHRKISELQGALTSDDTKTEAAEILRTLIDAIILTPEAHLC